MSASINPQNEERRAQAMLSSLTQYEKAADLFAPRNSQGEMAQSAARDNRHYGEFFMRVMSAIKLTRRPVVDEPLQHSVSAPRQATTAG